MRKTFFAILIALLAVSILSGCQSKTIPTEPPDIQVVVDKENINSGWTILKWDNQELQAGNGLKDFVTSSTGEEIPYYEIGKTIEVRFSSNPPDNLVITESLIDENGNLKYTDKETKEIPVELKSGKCSFEIAQHSASGLSSYHEESKKDIHGFRLTARWGENVCQYVFCIKTDADSSTSSKESTSIDPEKMKVDIKIISKSELPEGNSYALKLTNTSPYLIKQNAVYLSYPIKTGTSSSWNKCKVEATGNKLDIKPNEEVDLNVFVDRANIENSTQLDIENPEIEFQCYANEVTENTHYQQVGDWSTVDN